MGKLKLNGRANMEASSLTQGKVETVVWLVLELSEVSLAATAGPGGPKVKQDATATISKMRASPAMIFIFV